MGGAGFGSATSVTSAGWATSAGSAAALRGPRPASIATSDAATRAEGRVVNRPTQNVRSSMKRPRVVPPSASMSSTRPLRASVGTSLRAAPSPWAS